MARSPVEAEKESDVTPAAAETPEFDDVTLRAIAEVYKNEGNDEYRKKELSSAVDFYTQGIQVNCKDEELKAKLFSNRAAAHFHLGNYHDSLSDAKAAKSLQPSYIKPIERGASACEKLRLFQEAITWCDEGLAIDPNNKMLLQLRTRSVNEQDKLRKAAREKMRSDSDTQTVGGKDGGSIQAIQLYALLLGRAKIMKNRAEEGTACFHLAETYETLGDFSRAIEYYKQCLDIAKELGDRAREGALCSKLGVCSKMLGCFKEALQYHRKHLTIAKDVRDRNGEGLANCNIGTTYRNLGDLDQALYYTKQHLDISKTLGDRNGEGDAYGNLANTYASLGDIKQALWYNKEALSIAKEARDRIKEAIIHANIGSAYQRLGDFKQALKYHKQLLPIAKELGRKDLEGVAYGSIGNALSSLGNLKEALDYQKRHLNIAQSVGNRADEGAAYSNIGVTYRDLGDLKQALKFHKQSLTIAKEIGNKATEGSVYGNLGTTYQLLGDFKEALDCNKQKLRIALEIGDRHAEGRAYGCLGSTYRSLGDFKQALDCSTQQLSIALERGDRPAEGSAYGNIGDIYQCLGDFKTALIYQKRRLQIAEEVGDTAAQGCAHNSIGLAYNDLGDYKQALHYYQQSLRIIKQVGHRHGEGQAYGNIGNTYQYLGDFEQAILYHTEHLSIAKEVSDRAGEGCAYGSLGNCYRNLEDFEQAIIYHKERLHIAKEVGDKEGEGVAYGNIGNTYLNLGDVEKGLEYLKNALDFAKNLGKRAAEGQACGNLGIAYLRLCDFEQAINYLKQQLTIAKEVGDRAGEGKAYHSLGRSFEALGSFSDALDWYQASVTQFNSIRRLLRSKDDWKISLRNQYQLTYTALWRILLKQNKINEALVAAEEGRAQALTDLLESQYGFQPEQSGSGEQEETGRDILGRFPSNTVFLAVDENEINTWVFVDGQDAQFQKKNVGANALERGVPSSFQTLMENAYEAIGVRAGVKCENRSLDLLKDGDCNSAAGWKSDLKESRPGVDYDSPLRTLYDAIIDSVANLFQGDELIIVPDGPLFMAPFAALLDSDSHHLCESFRIRLLPSLTILKFIADSPADYHCRSGALLVGDPKVEGIGLPALPCARKEVEMIGRILKTSPLIGAEATKAEVLKRLNTVALVHIAAHGCKETGEIALAPNRRRQSGVPPKKDFLLTMADVLGAKLRARLVVLSCCHSGRGEIKAEGVVGIARAFLGAGARAVLVSLWAIDDGATLEFMTSFYHHLVEGRSASEALNKVMKHMKESKEYSDVKNWAPFTLIGDDVTLEFGENQDELSHGD